MGYIFTVVTISLLRAIETMGLLRVVETMGLIRVIGTMGLLWAVWSIGQTWATNVIQEILKGWMALWKQRNGDRHGRDASSRARIAKAQAIRELQQLYEYQGQIMDRHNWIFETPLQARMNLKPCAIRAFINSWKPVIVESYKERLATG